MHVTVASQLSEFFLRVRAEEHALASVFAETQ